MPDVSVEPITVAEYFESGYVPIIRSGAWADIGFRSSMEDVFVCVDNFAEDYGLDSISGGPSAFYGVSNLWSYTVSLFFNLLCEELKSYLISLIRFLMDTVGSMLLILPAVTCRGSFLKMKNSLGRSRRSLLLPSYRLMLPLPKLAL